MRLICPNCAAQYEVEDHVIPEGGRDVQCSNCGHTWYQRSASRPASRPTEPEPTPEHAAFEKAVAEESAEPEETEAESADAEEEIAEAQKPRPLDGGIADILREEAERERAEREAERQGGTLETQTDLGLDNLADETPPNIQERMARLREQGDELEGTAMAAAAAAPRRKELLPDIEEINSTLTPDGTDEAADPVAAEVARRGGFRRGFALVIILFAVMMAVYLLAPKIVEMNPQTAPALSAYVDWVNGLRAGLDSAMSGAAKRLSGLLEGLNGG